MSAMKVKLMTSRAGLNYVQSAGAIVDVSDGEAERLLKRNEAVLARDDDVETAVARPPETTAKGAAAKRRGRPRSAGKQPKRPAKPPAATDEPPKSPPAPPTDEPSAAPKDEPPPEPT